MQTIHNFSFYPSDLHSNITHLQNTPQQISLHSSWMTANLLTLDSSKLNSSLSDSNNNYSQNTNCHVSITHSVRNNLDFVFDDHLTFLTKFLCSVQKFCYSHIRELTLYPSIYLDFKTAIVPSLPPLFTPNMTTVPHCSTIFQIQSQQIHNALARAVITPNYSHDTSILKSQSLNPIADCRELVPNPLNCLHGLWTAKQFLRASAMLKHVIDIGWTSVRLSVCHTLARYQNG